MKTNATTMTIIVSYQQNKESEPIYTWIENYMYSKPISWLVIFSSKLATTGLSADQNLLFQFSYNHDFPNFLDIKYKCCSKVILLYTQSFKTTSINI